MQKEKEMKIPKITTIGSPNSISFKRFEHNEELFKKLPPRKPTGEENKKWTLTLYKPLHHI